MTTRSPDQNIDRTVPAGVRVAHYAAWIDNAPITPQTREVREKARENGIALPLSAGATRDSGAGKRAKEIAADEFRLPFERDSDRVKHSKPFRRLAGKCQVVIAPDNDHLRTRMTHAIEVAQVAVSIARALGLNVALAEAIALAHDCGHGPAGHASEDAFSPFMANGIYDHAEYGADVVLTPLNLCEETLDGVRNHSWKRPAPATPEGEVVAWADRIAYSCHDFEDAVAANIVTPAHLPDEVADVLGRTRSEQLDRLIRAAISAGAETGVVSMTEREADALNALREYNFQKIYLRPAANDQSNRVKKLLSGLVELYISRPSYMADGLANVSPGSPEAAANAVLYTSGMTDWFALAQAKELLGWAPDQLPRGVAKETAQATFADMDNGE